MQKQCLKSPESCSFHLKISGDLIKLQLSNNPNHPQMHGWDAPILWFLCGGPRGDKTLADDMIVHGKVQLMGHPRPHMSLQVLVLTCDISR